MATKLKDRASIEQIIREMSVEEKARLVIGGTPFCSEAFPEYGIPSMAMLDSCNGRNQTEQYAEMAYRASAAEALKNGQPLDRERNGFMGGLLIAFTKLQKIAEAKKAAGAANEKKEIGAYPPGICYGSTWNPDVVQRCSGAMAREMNSCGIDMVLGPNINIHRDPRCGRLAESISEDPCLVSSIAVAQVNGIQQEGVIACAKHFAANNQEKDRLGVEEHVPERALREIYLPGFRACVKAGVGSLMSAYNKLNGKPSAMNDTLLTDILRGEWNFDGFVVSDWGASYDQVAAIAAGTDLTMPGPRGIRCVTDAVASGKLPIEKLDNCVRHFLTVLLRTTAFSGKRKEWSREETVSACEAAAREGMILLKNNGVLPLSKNVSVAMYGKRSKGFVYCPEGSSKVISDLVTSPFERAVELLGEDHVRFEESKDDTRCWIAVIGANGHEGSDREDLSMDADDSAALEQAIREAKAASRPVIAIVNATGPVDLTPYEAELDAILCPFFAGMQGGKATIDAVFGLYNPSGKLPLTWPRRSCDTPAYRNFPGENKEVWYGEGMYVGYRWYDVRHIEPAYPFGFGLSYTDFQLLPPDVPGEINLDQGDLNIQIRVKNTGSVAGSEVVQVYIHDQVSRIEKPYKQLKGFQKVFLLPGEEKSVNILLRKEDFAAYSLERKEWLTEPGDFVLLIGTSSVNLPYQITVKVKCKNPYGYSDLTAVGAIAKDPRALEAVNQVIGGDLRTIARVALEFGPDTPFGNIWKGQAMGRHFEEIGVSKEKADALRKKLQEAFDRIEIS